MGTALQAWQNYFIFTGSIAATLLGLLFVAISLNAETILSGSHRHLRELAGQTFQNFILAVLVSLIFLFPRMQFVTFGFLGAYGLCWVAYRLFIVLRMPGQAFHWVQILRRMLPAAVACGCMTYAGFWLRRNDLNSALVALGAGSALLLISGTASSWDLLVKVAEYRQRR